MGFYFSTMSRINDFGLGGINLIIELSWSSRDLLGGLCMLQLSMRLVVPDWDEYSIYID
jgi:hypothetical protein